MKKVLFLAVVISLVSFQSQAHSGRTDSSGGHNCSQKSKDKGLCTGYHYHNGKWIPVDITQSEESKPSEATTIEKPDSNAILPTHDAEEVSAT